HFMTLADKVDLPIVLYNIPGRTGVTMSAQTVAKLSQHRNIVAIKEATGVLDMTSEIASLCHLPILSGDDSLTLPIMSLGGRGVISVISNLLPGKVKQMVSYAQDGNYAEARAIHFQLFPLIKAIFLDGNPVGIKHAMKIAGMDTGELRLPLWEASEATKKQIEVFMAPAGAPFAV
ncbi:MAG: dapA, partial [Phycisphaerales bacterium]|nr:dapA [Phycisphaerales bacterium]